MRRLSAVAAGLAAWTLPAVAHACTICGQHGDTTKTLYVYGAFMSIPFAVAGGLGWFIRAQLRQLPPNGGPDGEPPSGGPKVPRVPTAPVLAAAPAEREPDRELELV